MTDKRDYRVFLPFVFTIIIFMTVALSIVLVTEELNTVSVGPCVAIETTDTSEITSCGEYDKSYSGGLVQGNKYYLQLKGTDFLFFTREITGATLATIDMER